MATSFRSLLPCLWLALGLACVAGLHAQPVTLVPTPAPVPTHVRLRTMRPPKTFDNVHVQILSGDSLSTAFVIWIQREVPAHYHAAHSETVLVLRGRGEMLLGEQRLPIRKGDLIFIPQGTPHSVTVKGRMLQVLSSQSPHFDGKDRVKVER